MMVHAFAWIAAGCADGIRDADPTPLVAVPGGSSPMPVTFPMGSDVGETGAVITACRMNGCAADRLPHMVTVSPFSIDQTEVTLLQYTICVARNLCPPAGSWDYDRRNQPIAVPIDAARTYCETMFPDKKGRLPTEAEWELAARYVSPGVFYPYPWGKSPILNCSVPSVESCGAGGLPDVGTTPADKSGLGILDMGGSLPEWVEDDWVPALACADATPLVDLCSNDGGCIQRECPSPSSCLDGCAPDITQVTNAPYCMPGSKTLVDPLVRTSMPTPMFKGGGKGLDPCYAEAGMRTRYAMGSIQPVGFRCAYGARPPVKLTERLELHPPATCTQVRVQRSTSGAGSLTDQEWQGIDAALFDVVDGRTAATHDADDLLLSCGAQQGDAMLLLDGAPEKDFVLHLTYEGAAQSACVFVRLGSGETPYAAVDKGAPCP
jgi:hypothetical protein